MGNPVKKIIQIPIDDELLSQLDEVSSNRDQSRSDLIREACQAYLYGIERDALEQRYQRGYQSIPEETSSGETQIRMVGYVLPKETW